MMSRDDSAALQIRLRCSDLTVSLPIDILVRGADVAHDICHPRIQLGLSAKIRCAPAYIRRPLLILLMTDTESR
jgi:hypothetical protein